MAIFILFVESRFLLDGLMPSLNSKPELNLVTSTYVQQTEHKNVALAKLGQCTLMCIQTSGELSAIIKIIFDESEVDHKVHKPFNSLEINDRSRLRCAFCLRVCVL